MHGIPQMGDRSKRQGKVHSKSLHLALRELVFNWFPKVQQKLCSDLSMYMPNSPSLRSALTLLSMLLFCQISFSGPGALNDTGITFCGDTTTNTANCTPVGADSGAYPRQDARYGRDAQAAAGKLTKVGGGSAGFDFTKIANDGSDLPASAVLGTGPKDWACTRDNVTSLTWEVKTISGLRSMNQTYTWYNSNPTTNGGAVGTESGGICATVGRCDTEKFMADVNELGLCGSNDWRIPTQKELEGIADLGRVRPAIDPTYFPNTQYVNFWTSLPAPNQTTYARIVDFASGRAGVHSRNGKDAVRLVRTEQ
jgi:hypothetical protein